MFWVGGGGGGNEGRGDGGSGSVGDDGTMEDRQSGVLGYRKVLLWLKNLFCEKKVKHHLAYRVKCCIIKKSQWIGQCNMDLQEMIEVSHTLKELRASSSSRKQGYNRWFGHICRREETTLV